MSKIYVSSCLMGGLGNQLFQIAHAKAQSLRYKVKCIFRPHSNTFLQGNPVNVYMDNIFRNVVFKNEIPAMVRIHEQSWAFSQTDIDKTTSIEFYGYFQSSKNFYGFDKEIKKFFSPTKEFIKKIKEKYPNLNKKNTTSIHVRRGDYLKFPEIHPTVDITYINEALTKVKKNSFIFIFSDDRDWALENLNLPNSILVNNEFDYEDLWMMSLCKNNIICNSSFSWWAAFLNKNKNKKVIIPSIWFGPNVDQYNRNYEDIFEKDWEIINTEFKNGKICY